MNVAHWVLEPLIEGLFIPRNVCRLEGGRVVKTSCGSALAADDAGERGTDLIHAWLRRVTGAAVEGEKLLAGGRISGRKARGRAERDCRDHTQRIFKNGT